MAWARCCFKNGLTSAGLTRAKPDKPTQKHLLQVEQHFVALIAVPRLNADAVVALQGEILGEVVYYDCAGKVAIESGQVLLRSL